MSVVKDIIGDKYFDFGTVGVVRKDQLRVLQGMFRALPSRVLFSPRVHGHCPQEIHKSHRKYW